MKNNNWVRGAMLLAVGLVLQALRLVIPMPPMWTVFVVGTLVRIWFWCWRPVPLVYGRL